MTPRMREFCKFYVETNGAYESALRAGYTKQYAHSKAFKMLQHPEIIAEVKRIRKSLNERADKSATDVVNEFSKIAFTDRVSFLKEDEHFRGNFIYKSPDELTDDQRAIVEKVTYSVHEIETVVDGERRTIVRQEFNYILSDKSKALENMGRHFGIYDDKIKLVANNNNPFKNASPEQLQKLQKAIVKTMNEPIAIEGEVIRK